MNIDFKNLLSEDLHMILFLFNLTLSFILMTGLFIQASKIKQFKLRWSALLKGPNIKDFEQTFLDLLNHKEITNNEIQWLKSHTRLLDDRLSGAVQNVGCVRFDAFQDMGGQQSFALALCDDKKDGILLTCLIGRSDCRIYCKPIEAGKSNRQLNAEETQAIEAAFHNFPEKSKNKEFDEIATKILK